MERTHIDESVFREAVSVVNHTQKNICDEQTLKNIYTYLLDKTTEHTYSNKDKETIRYAELEFLHKILSAPYVFPRDAWFKRKHLNHFYGKGFTDFINSDYLSSMLKRDFYEALHHDCCTESLLNMLQSDTPINGFSRDDITHLSLALTYSRERYSNSEWRLEKQFRYEELLVIREKQRKCRELIGIFYRYIYELNGKGPIEFTKIENASNLHSTILKRSGIYDVASYYHLTGVNDGYINADNLYSVYLELVKFFPEKSDEFVEMVNSLPKVSAYNIVTKYNHELFNPRMKFENPDDLLRCERIDDTFSDEEEQVANEKILKRFNNLVKNYRRKSGVLSLTRTKKEQ